ncbi:MAG TPA: tetratricopeptide repeat protein, partial [Planctomycetota bacterium]|nr:tetratricopeptide repeat protein [Planctomycetota bacterium]
ADTLRRVAVYLAMFSRSHWRMASSDLPSYFSAGYYYMAVELGVLRYPTAELPEVVACCRRRRILQDSKARMIEDVLALWEIVGDGLSAQLSLALRRLLSERSLSLPGKLEQWKAAWAASKENFERPVRVIMEGIVAAADGNYSRAETLFSEAAVQQPGSLPLVNLIYLRLQQKRHREAQALVETLQSQYPRDAAALISAGRLLAMYREDTREAEALFSRALAIKENDPEDNPVEALICLGEIKLLQGQYLEAQQYFENARQADPMLPDPRLGLARVYLETRRYERAIEHLNDIVAQPQPLEATCLAHYLLYRAYREIGNDRRAFNHIERVPPPFFKEPDVLDDIAFHLESGKQYARAREFAERAMLLRAAGRGRNDDADMLKA